MGCCGGCYGSSGRLLSSGQATAVGQTFAGNGWNTIVTLSMSGAGLYLFDASVLYQIPSGNLSRTRITVDGVLVGVNEENTVATSAVIGAARSVLATLADGPHVIRYQGQQDGAAGSFVALAGAMLRGVRFNP